MIDTAGIGKWLKNGCLWLLPGFMAGFMMAALLTVYEYHTVSELTGSMLAADSIQEGVKQAGREYRRKGEEFLKSYGYDSFGYFPDILPYTLGIGIVLFQGAGWLLFFRNRKKEHKLRHRIDSLTEYLRAVNSGKAGALTRIEDGLSHLEDEIYKTVIELKCTKESAVHDHEVLSARIADIAHQLKTPLTSMLLMTELLEEQQGKESEEYFMRLKNQTDRLRRLVAGLLSLAKLDSHTIIFKKEPVELWELIHMSMEPFKEMTEQKNIIMEPGNTGKAQEPVFIKADWQWTLEALTNVLKNCLEHTPVNGKIYVSYTQNPLYTEIQIQDSGQGFQKQDLPHVFERFYRGCNAAKDSAGIGLALARLVLEQQNGHIYAENTAQGHARFRIRFYA